MCSFSIRRAQPSDAPKVIATINAVSAEGIWLATDEFILTPLWERVLYHPDAERRALLLVADVGESIVGWCRVFPYDFGSKSLHVADLAIGILKEFRRRGIGRALLQSAIAWARIQSYEKLTLDVYASNAAAVSLYEQVGFHQIGRRARQIKINDMYVDEILMEREI